MRWLRCALAAVLTLLAFGCAQPVASDDGVTHLTLWHAYRGAELEALDGSKARYEAAHPEVRINLVGIPYDAFPNKVSVAVPRGNGPDLFIFAHDRVGDWAAAGVIEPIGFWADEPLLDRFFGMTLEPLVYRGELFGLPLAFKTLALYYDRTLVAQPPANTADLIAQCKALRAKDSAVWGLGYELESLYFHAPWLHGFGGQVYLNEQDELALDSAAAAKSVAFVRRLVAVEKIVPEEVTSALVTTLFKQRKLAFVMSGPWFRGELEGHTQWGVAPLPVVSETGLRAKPFLGVEGVLLSAKSPQKRAAFAFMRFLTQDAEAQARLASAGQLVANQRPYESPEAKADALVSAFRQQVEHTVSLSNRPHMRAIWTPMKTALSKGIVHGDPPAEALREAAATIGRATE
jgi:maltose-binding protein MalE